MDCPSCGTGATRPDQRFCAKCGTNLAPVVPPAAWGDVPRISGPLFADDVTTAPPPAPPTAPPPPAFPLPPVPAAALASPPPSYDDRGGRRRGPIVLLAVAAVVAALIGAGGVVLLFSARDDEPSTRASAGDQSDSTIDASESSPGASPPTSSATGDPVLYRCWNGGTAVTRLSACGRPAGSAGLAWVFPSSAGDTCSVDAGPQRVAEAECYPSVAGDDVRFHYSLWRSRTALEGYYGGDTVATLPAPYGRDDLAAVRVASRAPSVGFKVAIYYQDPSALWSVTIYAADEAQYQAALDTLEVRPFRQLNGEPL
jgi:hypothetical protein